MVLTEYKVKLVVFQDPFKIMWTKLFLQDIISRFIVSVRIQIQSEDLPHGMLRGWRKLPLLSH
jgi:hypothetical protein